MRICILCPASCPVFSLIAFTAGFSPRLGRIAVFAGTCQFSRGFENFQFNIRKGKCAHGMATAALELDHSRRFSSGELYVPWIGWTDPGRPAHRRGRYRLLESVPPRRRSLPRWFPGCAESLRNPAPACLQGESRRHSGESSGSVVSLEELLSVEIGSNDLNRQLKFGRRCRDRIGQRVLPFLTQYGGFANQRTKKGTMWAEIFHMHFTTRLRVWEAISSSCRLMIMNGSWRAS